MYSFVSAYPPPNWSDFKIFYSIMIIVRLNKSCDLLREALRPVAWAFSEKLHIINS